MSTERHRVEMPSILDREISSDNSDAFGHRHFALALRSLIESPTHMPPYSIGLLGTWGTGKSTIKRLYLENLLDDTECDTSGKKRSDKCQVVTFNAWRYGGDDMKRALLRHVFLELGGDDSTLRDVLFRKIERTFTERREWRDIWADIADRWLFGLLQILFPFTLVAIFLISLPIFYPSINDVVYGTTVVAVMTALGVSLKQLLATERFLVNRTAPVKRIELPHTSAEQYEDLLIDQINKYKTSKEGKSCERLVVFVDDLDRLSAEEMVSGLDAVRTFMEIPSDQIKTGLGIIFIISCDEDRVAQAISGRHRRLGADLPATVFSHSDARRYLDRIFQFRLEIPPFPKRDMREYATQKLKEAAPEIISSIDSKNISLADVIDRMIHPGVESPRNALQIVNAFIQSWWIAERREREGAGSDRAGALSEGAVTDHPASLAIMSGLRVSFPQFYADLQEDVELLNRFDQIVFRGQPLSEQPITIQPILKRYLDKEGVDFQAEHASLRQFLSSIRGHRWPPSLQALLLLTQDPLTRRYGDRSIKLHQAFVSGDTREVLAQLGRAHDPKPLQVADVQKLRDLNSELYQDTDIHRNNAAFVLAELADRLPVSDAHFLMSPLARRLAESPELRWRVTVSKIRAILETASESDRQDVASVLIDDLLLIDDPIKFNLDTGEPPSLGEAVEMVREACDLLLWIRSQDGLDDIADANLMTWLRDRPVKVVSKQSSLPFHILENWIIEYESGLLPVFGPVYAELVVAQFEADDLTQLKHGANDSIGRLKKVFDAMYNKGEDTRPRLWELLHQLVGVRHFHAMELAYSDFLTRLRDPNEQALSNFVLAFAKRLNNYSEGWSFESVEPEETLLRILDARRSDVLETVHKSLIDLCITWSNTDGLYDHAVQLAEHLSHISSDLAHAVLDEWCPRILDDLSSSSIKWIAKNFNAKLNAKNRQAVTTALQPVHSPGQPSKIQGDRYRIFVNALDDTVLQTPELQQFFGDVLAVVVQRQDNQNDYLKYIFPVLPSRLAKLPQPAVGRMLQSLFIGSASHPNIYGWLHGQMADYWPQQSAQLEKYQPQQLFNQAHQFLVNQPAYPDGPSLLKSLSGMIHRGAINETEENRLIELAFKLWPSHQTAAHDVLSKSNADLPIEHLVAIIDSVDMNDTEQIARLKSLWTHAFEEQDTDSRVDMTRQILAHNAKESDILKDAALSIWVDSLNDEAFVVLKTVFLIADMPDPQRRRIWLQIERIRDSVGLRDIVELIPEITQNNDVSGTIEAIIIAKDEITAMCNSAEERHMLGESLAKAMISISSREVKTQFMNWLRTLGASTIAKNIHDYGDPSEDDIEIVIKAFPELRKSFT